MKQILTLVFSFLSLFASGQEFLQPSPEAQHWVEQNFRKLSRRQKIAQLMVIRLSGLQNGKAVFYDQQVAKDLKKFDIGSVCLFQGNAAQQAEVINRLQAKAKTPLLVCIDGETGVGMRFSDVTKFPDQLTIGAVPDAALAYKIGRAIGQQCKRAGVQVNYAPVVDINNNPANPVINFRSFGEDKYKVALMGTQIMKGMQDEGVMACAKHFPGHGDVSVDSHKDLPVITKSLRQLDSLELYPFKQMIKGRVGSMMIAHLYIPAIDSTPNQATSLSKKNVTGLLRNQLHFKGITFTDALEMKGVTKFYPQGKAAVQSLIAGNDMLCLPGDIKGSIKQVRKAIRHDRLSWDDIDRKVQKVLLAKYNLGLNEVKPISVTSIKDDLNTDVDRLKREVYENAITLLSQVNPDILPLKSEAKVAYVGLGIDKPNHFARQLEQFYNTDTYCFDYAADSTAAEDILKKVQNGYDEVIVGIHNYHKYPAGNFGISKTAARLMVQLGQLNNSISFVFGNPYAIKNISATGNMVACYEDDSIMHEVAVNLLQGTLTAKGHLPVSVGPFHYGSGITVNSYFPVTAPELAGFDAGKLNKIDSVALNAISKGATPGCVVLAARNGKIGFYRAYGHMDYSGKEPVTRETVYDLASVTKISATTVSVMKLYEEGKLDLQKTLGDYLPWVRGTNKAGLKIEDVLLHQAGLVAYIPFYKETIDADGKPKPGFYISTPDSAHTVRVARDMYMRTDWVDTIYKRILQSKVGPRKYIYSDNDFIFMGKVVEQITGKTLDQYVHDTFYVPLRMSSTTFKPWEHAPLDWIAPTENEKFFRLQQLRGDVHDPGSAMFGGVAGHAGLFSNAYDLAQLYQMLLNGGELNGIRFLKKETIDYFTAYHSDISRRGIGFDKPLKDNAHAEYPYPCASASPLTFGHTGFTGIGVWADPKYDLLYIFLSNRVCPDGGANGKLSSLNIRSDIQDIIYNSMIEKTESGSADSAAQSFTNSITH